MSRTPPRGPRRARPAASPTRLRCGRDGSPAAISTHSQSMAPLCRRTPPACSPPSTGQIVWRGDAADPGRVVRRTRDRLRRGVGAPARAARPRVAGETPTPCCCSSTRRSTPPASAPSRTSGRSTARPWSTSTAAARSPGTAPVSSSATRSSGCPTTSLVVDYVRRLEEALIAACADLGVTTGRVEGRSGVWLPADEPRRSARSARSASGSSRGVTMHGFALNCDVDLAGTTGSCPCGIADAGVTSLSAELGRRVERRRGRRRRRPHLRDAARLAGVRALG